MRKTKPNVLIGGNISKTPLLPIIWLIKILKKPLPNCTTMWTILWSMWVVPTSKTCAICNLWKIWLKLSNVWRISAGIVMYTDPFCLKYPRQLHKNAGRTDWACYAFRTGWNHCLQHHYIPGGARHSGRKIKAIGEGGLSGAPLKEKALAVVRYIREKTEGNLPIIGVGGIMSPEDAQEMLDAGAWLIQVYTGFIYGGPGFVRKILKHIDK